MGNIESKVTQPTVPMRVLISEIASLNQTEVSEMVVAPTVNETDSDEDFGLEDYDPFKRCKKYTPQEHQDLFIPIKEVTLERLPESVRHPEFLEWIKTVASQTVKLSVRCTSKDRPKHFHIGGAMGTTTLRNGTGYVAVSSAADRTHVSVITDSDADGTMFKIKTAAHVVFNNEEAKATTVDFFFEDDSKEERSSIVRAKGVRIDWIAEYRDECTFICKVKDKAKAAKVIERLNSRKAVGFMPATEDLAFCVSHPHGKAQRFSLGTVKVIGATQKTGLVTEHLKILVHRCHTVLGVDEKKVFYVWIGDHTINTNLIDKEHMEALQLSAALLSHLLRKDLISTPTDQEIVIIKEIEDNLKSQISKETQEKITATLAKMELSKPQTEADERALKRVIVPEVVRNLSAQADVDDGFSERFKTVTTEMNAKFAQLRLGPTLPARDIVGEGSWQYTVPTCIGSSGAHISAVHVGEGERVLSGTHSRKDKSGFNRTLGGFSFAL